MVYAQDKLPENPVVSDDIIITPKSFITYWERNGIINTYTGDYELAKTNIPGTTTEVETKTTTCKLSEVSSVEASFKAKGYVVESKLTIGESTEQETMVKITFSRTIKKPITFNRYIKYKYYYEGGNLLNDHGCIIKRDPYHFFIKKESTGIYKDVVVG